MSLTIQLIEDRQTLICYKKLPNGKLEIGKEYITTTYKGDTDFSDYYIFKIEGSYFSSVVHDPYYIGNYFYTKAEWRQKQIDSIIF